LKNNHPKWDDNFKDMTVRQANCIRKMRVEYNCSWRVVAGICDGFWNGNWGENQIVGMDICKRAMEVLGQTWEDWGE